MIGGSILGAGAVSSSGCTQSVTIEVVARHCATLRGLLPASGRSAGFLKSPTPDRFLGIDALIFALSVLGLLWCVSQWVSTDFGPILDARILRVLVLSFTGLAAGVQFVLIAFLFGLIESPHGTSGDGQS